MPTARGVRAGRAYVEIGAMLGPLEAGLRRASNIVRGWGSKLQQMGRQATMAAGAMAAPLAFATRTYMGFSDQMKAVQAVTGATEDSFRRLTETAKFLGRTTSYTAAEVAAGMLNLARAGFSVDEIDRSIAGMMDLARATGTDLALASDIAAGTLRAFNLEASQSQHVADVLTATANNSAQTLEDLGEAMKYVAPIAQEYGLTLEETAKAIGTLANVQIKGSMAGTSIRQMLLQLTDPNVRKTIEGLGVSVTDSAGRLRKDFGSMMLELGEAMKKLPEADRLAILRDLFDQRAAAGAAKLASASFANLGQAIDNATGVAAKTAKTMDSAIGGAWRRLTSAIEGVQIAVGETLDKALGAAIDTLGEYVGLFTEWINANRAAVMVVTGLIAGVGAIGVSLVTAGLALKVFAVGVSTLATLSHAVVIPFQVLGGLLSVALTPAGLLVTTLLALGAVAVYITDAWKPIFEYLGQGFQWVGDIATRTWKGVSDALARGDLQLAGEIAMAGLKVAWYEAIIWIQEKWLGFKRKLIEVWYDAVYGIAQMALTGFSGLQTLWANVQGTFRRLWVKTTKFLADAWDIAYGLIAKALVNITHAFSSAAEAAAARKAIDQEIADRAAAREKETAQRFANIDKEAAKIDKELMDSLATLEEDKQRALQDATAGYGDNLDDLRKRAEEARKEFDRLTQGQPGEDGAGAGGPPAAPVAPELPKAADLNRTLQTIGGSGGGGGAAGTFSALAARNLGMSGPLDRIAKAAENTADNTKRMTRLLEEADAEFI